MNINQLIETIHVSIHEANRDYANWTGGWWLQAYGVEGFLVSRIADGIMNPKNTNRPGFLTLETSFSELYDVCGLPRGRRSKHSKNNNRIDIALYHKNESLSHVIEVKRFWSPACSDDLLRLSSLYKKFSKSLGNGNLKEALFIQLVNVSSKRSPSTIHEKLNTYFESIEKRCTNIINKAELNCQLYKGTDYCNAIVLDDNTEAFSSFCLRLLP